MAQAPSKSGNDSGSASVEDLSKQIDRLKGDIAELTRLVGDVGKAKGQEIAGAAQARVDGLRSDAEAHLTEAEAYVRKNPATAVGIAAAIGLLIGLLTSRR